MIVKQHNGVVHPSERGEEEEGENMEQGKGERREEVRREGKGKRGKEQGKGESGGQVLQNILSLWREKVFVLLVQARVKDIHHNTELHDTKSRVSITTTESA